MWPRVRQVVAGADHGPGRQHLERSRSPGRACLHGDGAMAGVRHVRHVRHVGPGQGRKTATAMRRAASVVDLSLPGQREIVAADPAVLTRLPGPVLVDEWQRLPEVWDHVRRAVDAGSPAGHFIIAGSSAPRGAVVRRPAARPRSASGWGQHDGAARVGPFPQQGPQPSDPLWVQPVGRLVQHQDVRIGEQRRRETKPWRMPSEYLPTLRRASCSRPTSASTSDTRARGSPAMVANERRCMRAERPGWGATWSDEGSQGMGVTRRGLVTVQQNLPCTRPGNPADHLECRGLARSIGSEESGDGSATNAERYVLNGGKSAVVLCRPSTVIAAPARLAATASAVREIPWRKNPVR